MVIHDLYACSGKEVVVKVWVVRWDSSGLAAYADKETILAMIPDWAWEDIGGTNRDDYIYISDYIQAELVEVQ